MQCKLGSWTFSLQQLSGGDIRKMGWLIPDCPGFTEHDFTVDSDDPRLGCGAIALIDNATGAVMNFGIGIGRRNTQKRGIA